MMTTPVRTTPIDQERPDGVLAFVVVGIAAVGALFTLFVLGVGDKEECSSTFHSVTVGTRSIQVCESLSWFTGLAMVATVAAVLWSIHDIRRHGQFRRVVLYLGLIAAAVGCYLLPVSTMGFR